MTDTMTDTCYHFLSSMRQGLAAAITAEAADKQKRAKIGILLHPHRRKCSGDWDTDVQPIEQTVQLYGPGDVVGFDERMVVRTDPKPDTGNFEPNYFPAIEFADPDFVWRFSAKPADDKGLTPWIVLIVLIGEDRGDDIRREFEEIPRGRNQVPVIKVLSQKNLPNLNHARQWAHVQATTVQGGVSDDEDVKDLIKRRPDCVVSRLLCPRRLKPKTLYTAFVVPAYKLGWAAGLDTKVAHAEAKNCSAVDPSWDWESDTSIKLPFYYRWDFRTSVRGDFEYLVRLLEPRKIEGLGLRKIDCEHPGFGLSVELSDVDDSEKKHCLDMEGALQSLNTKYKYTRWGKDKNGPPDDDPPPPIPEPEVFQQRLAEELLNKANSDRARVELPAEFDPDDAIAHLSFDVLPDGKTVRISWATATNTTGRIEYGVEMDISDKPATSHTVDIKLTPETKHRFRFVIVDSNTEAETTTGYATIRVPLPAVVPPIYGRWHAACQEVSADKDYNSWLDVLNLDPRHRAAAGLGSEVVRKEQEALMASAWDQIGEIEAANDILRRAQFGREGSNFLHDRLGSMALEDFLRTTAPAQERVIIDKIDKGTSVTTVSAEQEVQTRVPAAALAPAFRRIARARGPIRKRQEHRRMDVLRRLASGQLRSAGEHPKPEGTPSPCEITKRMFQEYLFITGEETVEDEGEVSLGQTNIATDETVVGETGGGTSLTYSAGSVDLAPDDDTSSPEIFVTPDMIQVPENAKRFCDDRITCAQVRQAFGAGVKVFETLIEAVCDAFTNLLRPSESVDSRPLQPANYFTNLREDIHNALDPQVTIKERVKRRLRLNGDLSKRFEEEAPGDPLDEIMAYPEFPQPMYESLRDLSQAYVLPGVEKVPQNTVGLLETNGRFLESYMVGLNHEFAGELLWRKYPTDQRGSYFRQFWDVSEYVPRADERLPLFLAWLTEMNQRTGLSITSVDEVPDTQQERRLWQTERKRLLMRHFERLLEYLLEIWEVATVEELQDAYQVEVSKGLREGRRGVLSRISEEDTNALVTEVAIEEQLQEKLRDITTLVQWKKTPLGGNDNRQESKGENLVLIIRGDLLKRYPNAVIYSVDARPEYKDGQATGSLVPDLAEFEDPSPAIVGGISSAGGGGHSGVPGAVSKNRRITGQRRKRTIHVLAPPPDPGHSDPIYPIFRGSLGADLVFLGFPFSDTDAKSSPSSTGKFFIFEERITEARFGLDKADSDEPEQDKPIPWDELSWGHFQLADANKTAAYLDSFTGTIKGLDGEELEEWNTNTSAALRARITLQKPVRLAMHADQMIPDK